MFALEPNADIPDIANAVNYLLANFSGSVSANNVSGQITGPQNAVVSYLFKYLAIKYSDSFDGTLNFSDDPTNRTYYGLYNSDTSAESTDPTKYVWIPFTFGTTKFIWYVVTGGRQIQFAIQETPPNDSYKLAGIPSIDLDLDINDIILRIQDVSIEAGIADTNAQQALCLLQSIKASIQDLSLSSQYELAEIINGRFNAIYFGSNGGALIDIGGVPYLYGPTVGIGNNTNKGIVLDGVNFRPSITNSFALGTTTYSFSSLCAADVQLIKITGVPYVYSNSTSIGIGNNSTYGMILDANSWRPSVAGVFGIGSSSFPVTNVYFGSLGGRLLDITGVPYLYTSTTSVGLGNSTGGMVLDATAWRPAIASTFGVGTTTYPVSSVHFGAVNGTLIDVSGVPYLYSGGTSVGIGNVSGYGMVLDATAWRPSVASVFDVGSATYPVKDVHLSGKLYAPAQSYTGTGTGFTTTPTNTIVFSRIGETVTLSFTNISGVSNSTAFTITGGTVDMRPGTLRQCVVAVEDNGIALMGIVRVNTSGTIDVYAGPGNLAFTASGNKGLIEGSICYNI